MTEINRLSMQQKFQLGNWLVDVQSTLDGKSWVDVGNEAAAALGIEEGISRKTLSSVARMAGVEWVRPRKLRSDRKISAMAESIILDRMAELESKCGELMNRIENLEAK